MTWWLRSQEESDKAVKQTVRQIFCKHEFAEEKDNASVKVLHCPKCDKRRYFFK